MSARLTRSWGRSAILFLVAVFGVLPVGVNGHSVSGGNHDMAANSLVVSAEWVRVEVDVHGAGERVGDDEWG